MFGDTHESFADICEACVVLLEQQTFESLLRVALLYRQGP
jgi:hypothetical protein